MANPTRTPARTLPKTEPVVEPERRYDPDVICPEQHDETWKKFTEV